MDRRRKCALTKLKTLLNLLNEDNDLQQCGTGDAGNFGRYRTTSREKYPTCPAMARKCPPRRENVPFESTLRKKNYPLVPYREKPYEKCFQIHECSPNTTLCFKSAVPREYDQSNSYRVSRSSPIRGGRCPYTQRKSPKLYLISTDDPEQMETAVCRANRPLRKLQHNAIPPPRCCQSRELRGGLMYRGCDCDKTNGLQDRCLRFCCLRNPKCKTRPATCYLSRFSGGKHLPDITTRVSSDPTYVDFHDADYDCPLYEYEDHRIDPPAFHEDLDDTFIPNYPDYEIVNPRKVLCRSFPTCSRIPEEPPSQDIRMFTCCRREPKVLKIPEVIYESHNDACRFEPTKVCVFCPLSYMESPHDECDEW
ncbi:uncharacterized protein LOC123313684 [Coccinella septempunctata]|uniref:uncharacterized protein LOC123313684 n=1 Tax=Coccinella septempunctata TaxID=41139 RepID=UPI001D05E381|nr:uncharacterized protein LOC123313684 [Coccinella septempunctata]